MKRCWAQGHGECAGGMSREHYLSPALFPQPNIFVQGFDWCSDREVEIGLGSLTTHMLCRQHNSQLSPVDDHGIASIQAINRLETVEEGSAGVVDGFGFERWLLKTTINLSCQGPLILGMLNDSVVSAISPYLQSVVFGEKPLENGMGVYMLFPEGEYRYRQGGLAGVPIFKNGRLGAMYFHLRGLDFLLALFPGRRPTRLADLGLTSLPDHVLRAPCVYRPPSAITRTNHGKQTTLHFDWTRLPRTGGRRDADILIGH